MKNWFLIFIMLLFTLTIFGQAKKEVPKKANKYFEKNSSINGIGLFKLRTSKKQILDSLIILTGSYVEETTDRFEVTRKRKGGILRCKGCEGAIECPFSEMYLLQSLNIQGIELKEIVFKFFKDSLYEFQCNGSRDLVDALNTKYGEAKLESETKIIYCQNQGNGAQIQHEESTFTSKWRWDKNVKCWNTLRGYYNDDCEKMHHDMLYLMDQELSNRQHNCWLNQYKIETENNKKKLKDF